MLLKLPNNKFDIIYKIIEECFPEVEYRPYQQQKDLLLKENYHIYTIEKSIKGFIAFWEFSNFVYVEHLAIRVNYQGQKLGSKILKELKTLTKKTIILEVELPTNSIAKRRVKFYEKNGLFLNDYDYTMPALTKSKSALPLAIMSSQRKLTEDEFIDVKQQLYTLVYNKKPGSNIT
ncbi:MAG: GNAT family N-acetyltransferase [Erysipelotrichaceae bacterium]